METKIPLLEQLLYKEKLSEQKLVELKEAVLTFRQRKHKWLKAFEVLQQLVSTSQEFKDREEFEIFRY